MRTTVKIDEHLLAHARQVAIDQHQSLASLIAEALRQFLAARSANRPVHPPVQLPEDGDGGLQPGVDISNSSDLLMVMEKPDDSYGR